MKLNMKAISGQVPVFAGETAGVIGAGLIDAKIKTMLPEDFQTPLYRGAAFAVAGFLVGGLGGGAKGMGQVIAGVGSGMRSYGSLLMATQLAPDLTTVRIEGVGESTEADLYNPFNKVLSGPTGDMALLFAGESTTETRVEGLYDTSHEISGMQDNPYSNQVVSGVVDDYENAS